MLTSEQHNALVKAAQSAITAEQAALLSAHLQAVLEQNQNLNLTSITNPEEAVRLHIEDSLTGLPELGALLPGRLADLGSGAGFPGIPLAVLSGRQTTLVESTGKKAAFLQRFLDSAGMDKQVKVANCRIEELALQQPAGFVVVTARALSGLAALLELAHPLLIEGGALIAYKAKISAAELAAATSLESLLGMKLSHSREFRLSDGATTRTILVFQKTGQAQVKLPRRNGLAQHHPLKPHH